MKRLHIALVYYAYTGTVPELPEDRAGMSDLKRTVGAQVRYLQPNAPTALNVLRWYDTAWSN